MPLISLTYMLASCLTLVLLIPYTLAYLVFRRLFGHERAKSKWQKTTVCFLQQYFNDLFWQGHRVGLSLSKTCRYLDPGDQYRSVGQLCTWLLGYNSIKKLSDAQEVIKGLYQLEFSLSGTGVTCILNDVTSGAIGLHSGAVPVEGTQFVRPGEILNRDYMIPVSTGSYVKQPLGVIFLSKNKVISKARVLCN